MQRNNPSTMNEMSMNVSELLDALQRNRETHRELFLEAQEKYRLAVIEELDMMLKEAREKSRIRRRLDLPEPEDHTDEYDTAIRMLQMCTDEKIRVSSHDFQQYVMDNWDWSHRFSASNAVYGVRSKK